MALKLKVADIIFSRLIRERDGYVCQRCGTKYNPPTRAIHASHFWRRGMKKTRFDPRNVDALCYGCHQLWDSSQERHLYEAYKRKQLGDAVYLKVQQNARQIIKFGGVQWKQVHAYLKEHGLDGLVEYVEALR